MGSPISTLEIGDEVTSTPGRTGFAVNREDVAAPVVFVCPHCGAWIRVDEAMCETLVDRGCVLCGGSVSAADFTRPGSP